MTLNIPNGILFSDPQTNQRIPFGQLQFQFTGGGGFESVYQDAGLTTLWTQPILADANGNFPPNIYLDPSNINCRVVLSNALGVQQWFVDPYFIPVNITTDSFLLRYNNSSFELNVPNVGGTSGGTSFMIIFNLPGSVAIRLVGGGFVAGSILPSWEINNGTTGAQTANFTAVANKPGPANSTPVKWLPILFGGNVLYAPCFL